MAYAVTVEFLVATAEPVEACEVVRAVLARLDGGDAGAAGVAGGLPRKIKAVRCEEPSDAAEGMPNARKPLAPFRQSSRSLSTTTLVPVVVMAARAGGL